MSVAFIDSPTPSSSQLFFSWPEADHVELPGGQSFKPQATPAQTVAPVLPAIAPDRPPASLAVQGETRFDAVEHMPTDDRRCGEVRIGSVMIRLLKRYGITDAEINEGLADYARKTCHNVAS